MRSIRRSGPALRNIDGHRIDEFPVQVRNSFYDLGAQLSLTLHPADDVRTACQRLASWVALAWLNGGSPAIGGSGGRYQPYSLPAPTQVHPHALSGPVGPELKLTQATVLITG